MERIIYKSIHLLSMISLFSLVYDQPAAAASIAKPGCPQKCGNVPISYPFGIGKGCFLNEHFEVRCSTSSHSTPISSWLDSEVYEIEQGHVKIRWSPTPFFFNRSSGQSVNPSEIQDLNSAGCFSYSQTKNKFVSIGCDIYAFITDETINAVIGGCQSQCFSPRPASSSRSPSSCNGDGCCQSTLAKGFIEFSTVVVTMNTAGTKSLAKDSCSIPMIVEKDFDDFGRFDDISRCNKSYSIRVVLDWGIGNISCHEAEKRADYACGRNSKCIATPTTTEVSGYLCTCLPGYQGNAYLPDGCQDIDECGPHAKNNCSKDTICVNTPGSYNCNCRRGYYRKDSGPSENPCVPLPRSTGFLISLGIGIAVLSLILVFACIWMHRKLQQIEEKEAKKKLFKRLLQEQQSSGKEIAFEPKLFVTQDLKKATDNFNQSRFLGKGGFGTVYKGMLTDGTIVAVKKSNKIDPNQLSLFINEVLILSQTKHRHIVKLLGCCLETESPLLVYEYVSNGTLSDHLHEVDPSAGMIITWENRLRIATEIAGALAYLHSYASSAIFHRDIKPSNILLDENYRAVVSDFGLSRLVPADKTHLTTQVGGTFGYLDPEYSRSGQLNDKSDVYAFGVVLAELLTGQKAISSAQSEVGLARRFRSAVKENRLFGIVNKIVVDEGEEEEILIVAKLVKRCLKENASKRPTMKEITAELEQLRRKREGSMGKAKHHGDFCSVTERLDMWNVDP